jgi:hypothetical protein
VQIRDDERIGNAPGRNGRQDFHAVENRGQGASLLQTFPAAAAIMRTPNKLWEVEDIVALIDLRDERKRQSRAVHSMK